MADKMDDNHQLHHLLLAGLDFKVLKGPRGEAVYLRGANRIKHEANTTKETVESSTWMGPWRRCRSGKCTCLPSGRVPRHPGARFESGGRLLHLGQCWATPRGELLPLPPPFYHSLLSDPFFPPIVVSTGRRTRTARPHGARSSGSAAAWARLPARPACRCTPTPNHPTTFQITSSHTPTTLPYLLTYLLTYPPLPSLTYPPLPSFWFAGTQGRILPQHQTGRATSGKTTHTTAGPKKRMRFSAKTHGNRTAQPMSECSLLQVLCNGYVTAM